MTGTVNNELVSNIQRSAEPLALFDQFLPSINIERATDAQPGLNPIGLVRSHTQID